jgi:hypothetical protein
MDEDPIVFHASEATFFGVPRGGFDSLTPNGLAFIGIGRARRNGQLTLYRHHVLCPSDPLTER